MTATITSQQHHCQRPGCRGILRSQESIERGASKRCAKLLAGRIAEAKQGFNADQVANAERAVAAGEVTLDRDRNGNLTGLYLVKSSRSDERYASDGGSCVCPAGARAHSLRCWHLLAIRIFQVLTVAPVAQVIPLPVPAPRPAGDIWDQLAAVGATGTEDFIPAF